MLAGKSLPVKLLDHPGAVPACQPRRRARQLSTPYREPPLHRRLIAGLALAAAACGSSQPRPETAAAPSDSGAAVVAPATTPDSAARPSRRPRRNRDVITREEIDELGRGAASLYDFIVGQHFDWLRAPGGRLRTTRPISVYVDGTRWGNSPETMRQIPLAQVYMARRLSSSEAQAKYGLDNNSGTIEIFTSPDRVR